MVFLILNTKGSKPCLIKLKSCWITTIDGIKVYRCGINEFKSKQGVHVADCSLDSWAFDDALNTAERDNFKAIFIHDAKLDFKIIQGERVLKGYSRANLKLVG